MKENKIFIENLVARIAGSSEQELPADSRIRFHNNEMEYTIRIGEYGLEITKISRNHTISGDTISISPDCTNKIFIK